MAMDIVKGYAALAAGEKYEFTEERVRKCQKCINNRWVRRSLWCKICHCFVPAAARAEDKECPRGYWKLEELPAEATRKEL